MNEWLKVDAAIKNSFNSLVFGGKKEFSFDKNARFFRDALIR